MDRNIYHFDRSAVAGTRSAAPSRAQSARPRIGVIRNARSRHNLERQSSATPESGIRVVLPDGREEVAPALAELARDGLDCLVIDGGDGTVRDVLTLGQGVFADNAWPTLAVLPKGKTNALTLDLGLPSGWRLPDAIEALVHGHRVVRRPLAVSAIGQPQARRVLGFILGAGAFTTGSRQAQDAHSLGLFNNLAVGLTSASGILQTLFAGNSNPWRKGVEMQVTLGPEGRPAPRSPYGDPAFRSFALATSLERLPMDLRIFGKPRLGLKLALLDLPLRRIMLASPLVLTGILPRWLEEAGYAVHDVDRFEFDIKDDFIIDGEAFPAGRYLVEQGPPLTFVAP